MSELKNKYVTDCSKAFNKNAITIESERKNTEGQVLFFAKAKHQSHV